MTITAEEVEQLEKLIGQMEGFYEEMSLLSKKSPNDLINSFKLGLLNNALRSAGEALAGGYEPISGFAEFDVDEPPSTSDAVFVISQYRNELERLRSDNIFLSYETWYFNGEDEDSQIKTGPPRKILRK